MSASINGLLNKTILITAGPTREAIDPVRYISNHSSGKMGYALAHDFLARGARVILVSGPVSLHLSHERLHIEQVQSASEMYSACLHYFDTVDMAIFAAAVADYRPAEIATHKIKKNDDSFTIHLIKNRDIAFEFGQIKQPHQVSIGFALETDEEQKHALSKLEKKNFDMVVLNSMNDANAGFGHETNKVTLIQHGLSPREFPLKSKQQVAADIADAAIYLMSKKQGTLAGMK